MSKKTEAEALKRETIEYLQTIIKPGDTIYTRLQHVSKSGMMRVIRVYVIKDNTPWDITYHVAQLTGEGYNTRHDGCKIGGCGFNSGFETVYRLGIALFPNWECIGDHCPHNSHVNDRNAPKGSGVIHSSGGYALHQRWL